MPFRSVDPATGEVLESFDFIADAELEDRVRRSDEAFRAWRQTPMDARARSLVRAAEILEAERDAHAATMTREMGKLLRSAVQEAEKCARACRFYAQNAAQFLADEVVPTEARRSLVRYEPLGPVLAVMPWNFPFWQVFRSAAPALMAGNTVLLKHATSVPRCALAIEDVLRRAGLPGDVFQNLFVDVSRVERILADPRVRAVTLTGSDAAGSAVGALAGRHVKKCVLELGGSDPFVVMPSADLDRAVETAVAARIVNNGQSCIAAKRFVVHETLYAPFSRAFVARMRALKVGDPRDEDSDVGPLASADALRRLDEQVRRSVRAGARVLTGGEPLERPGSWYPPTVLADVPVDAPAYREELFGPVATIHRVPDLESALRVANDTPYGLAASVWTRDEDERDRLVDGLVAGVVFVNAMVVSDPRLPFGGTKRSGHGRELGVLGIREFVNAKTIWIAETP